MITKVILSLILIIFILPCVSYAAPMSYDDVITRIPLPYTLRQIKVKVKNPNYEKCQERLRLFEEVKIEREIQRLEKEEKRQLTKAIYNLRTEVYRTNPVVTVFNADNSVTHDINMAFIRSITRPDEKG